LQARLLEARHAHEVAKARDEAEAALLEQHAAHTTRPQP